MLNKKIFLIILLSILVAACARNDINQQAQPNKVAKGFVVGAAGGALLGSVTGIGVPAGTIVGGAAGTIVGFDHYLHEPRLNRLADRLNYDGVQLIRIGDNHRIIIPSDAVFVTKTPRLLEASLLKSASSVLVGVTEYLKGFKYAELYVEGYSDDQGSSDRALALTRQQAQIIGSYLWTHGVDARLIVVDGHGAAGAVASNATQLGRQKNRRIEIKFRDYSVTG